MVPQLFLVALLKHLHHQWSPQVPIMESALVSKDFYTMMMQVTVANNSVTKQPAFIVLNFKETRHRSIITLPALQQDLGDYR
jgi:hypothetical protein